MKTLSTTFLSLIVLMLSACDGIFQYNPNQVILKENETNLNEKNIARIKARPLTDTVKFILMGDTQRWYDEAEAFVKSANQQQDIAFVLHAGDISDFGLSQEFRWVHAIMSNLRVPYLTVIGNHDQLANGPAVYRKMYGPMDYSFEYGDNKFIFIDTNSREYAFNGAVPDLEWLNAELTDNPGNKNAIVVAHIPPFDNDFDPDLQDAYSGLLARDPNVKYTMYGHQHAFRDSSYYGDGVQYIQTTSTGDRGYLIFTTWKGGYKVDKVRF